MPRGSFPTRGSVPRPSDALIKKSLDAIEYLITRGGFTELNKQQFAIAMNWYDRLNGDIADRKLVERVCNLTRDQQTWPYVADILGGLVVAYSPTSGGMVLIEPDGERPLTHMLHILRGDMHKQQSCMTMNRRRQATWNACGAKCVTDGDADLARLFFQAEGEINASGFVSDTTARDLFMALRTRGLLEDEDG